MTTCRRLAPATLSVFLASLVVIIAPAIASAQAAQPVAAEPAPEQGPAVVARTVERATGDLDDMRQRGRVRVLVSFSRTNFFVSQGKPRGFDIKAFQARHAPRPEMG